MFILKRLTKLSHKSFLLNRNKVKKRHAALELHSIDTQTVQAVVWTPFEWKTRRSLRVTLYTVLRNTTQWRHIKCGCYLEFSKLIDLFEDFCQLHWLKSVECEFRIWKYDENCSVLFQGRETNPRICMGKLRKTTKYLVGIFNSSGQIWI